MKISPSHYVMWMDSNLEWQLSAKQGYILKAILSGKDEIQQGVISWNCSPQCQDQAGARM